MKKNKNSNPVNTLLVIVLGFLLVYKLFGYSWSLNISLYIGLLGFISRRFLKIIDYVWHKIALILSYFVPNIILSIIFYFFLLPISLLSKIFRDDLLRLKNNYNSMWNSYNRNIDRIYFEKIW